MNRLLKAATLALAIGLTPAPAFANTLEENMRNIASSQNVRHCIDVEKSVINAGNSAVSKSYSTRNASIMDEVNSRFQEAIREFGRAINKSVAKVENTDCDKLAKRAIKYINEPLEGK
jgi:hypothetical protein